MFLQRHPNLSKRVCQNLTAARASITKEKLRRWFKKFDAHLESKNLKNFSPTRYFNCDESFFSLCPSNDVVLAEKGTPAVYQTVGDSDKECLTVGVMASAAGNMPTPIILFDRTTIPNKTTLIY